MKATSRRLLPVVLVAVFALAAIPYSARANHAWGNYHWARSSNSTPIKVVDSNSSDWDDNLAAAIADWDRSVLTVQYEGGDDSASTRKRCRPISGKVRSCNAAYGTNGWLGLAQIWASGSHIVQGTSKMNDSYLASGSYNETARQHVMCQEIGHNWGLGHQSESGADLNTCMDYDRALSNPDPNQHDYDLLASIYKHTDNSTTIAAVPQGFANAELPDRAAWGQQVASSHGGRTAVFERNFGDDFRIFTFVTWVDPEAHEDHEH